MKLKIVKPKPKFYRIKYAMLDNLFIKEENKVISEEPKQTISKTQFADKYDKIVDEAIQKHLIDESDRETKLLELKSLSDKEFDDYANEVHSEVSMEVTNIAKENDSEDENLTEAEKALRKIKQSGPIIGDFSKEIPTTTKTTSFDGGDSRSLSDIKANRDLDISSYNEEIFMDNAMMDLSNKLKSRNNVKKEIVADKKPMSNLKGLTKPIVHESTQFNKSLNDIFSNLDWTMGGR